MGQLFLMLFLKERVFLKTVSLFDIIGMTTMKLHFDNRYSPAVLHFKSAASQI